MGDVGRGGVLSEIKWRLIGFLGSLVIRLVYLSVRVREIGLENIERGRGPRHEPVIFAFGHGRLLGNAWNSRGQGACVMVSRHKDGEIIARINSHLGYTAARGSATRGAVPAMMALLRAMDERRDLAITVDGPRGPAGVVKDGVVYASSRTRRPVIPTAAGYSACWRLGSWDRFQIPKPFSRMVVAYEPPIQVPEIDDLDEDALRPWREEIARSLQHSAHRADLAARSVRRMDSVAGRSLIEKFLTRGRDRWFHLPALVLLFPLEQLYRLGWKIREKSYNSGKLKTYRPSVPVVCVGSLCAGGSGKTPLTVLVASRLAARGKRVAVISRGYGSAQSGDPQIIRPGTARGDRLRIISSQAGDEPAMIARALPEISVVVCPERAAAAETAVEHCGAEVLVLDDGFGHRRLERDLDILAFSGRQITGQTHMFPSGFFREPAQAAARAGAIAVTGSLIQRFDRPGAKPVLPNWAEGKPLLRLERRVRGVARLDKWLEYGADECEDATQVLRGKHVIAFCALAGPGAFRDQVAGCGPERLDSCVWADHHRYSGGDQGRLRKQAAREGALLVTTEKDAVKLDPEQIGGETLVLCLELVEQDRSVLDGLLDSLL